LAAFRELEAFAQLGTDLDAATQQQLDRGYRMVELLKQGQYQPMDVVDQVMSVYAGNQGHLDQVPRNQVAAWEKAFLTFIKDQKPDIRKKISDTKDLDADTMKALDAAIEQFKTQFAGARKKEPALAKV
jgi:F-type H+/Na+-transporting ATPase subunit alpha